MKMVSILCVMMVLLGSFTNPVDGESEADSGLGFMASMAEIFLKESKIKADDELIHGHGRWYNMDTVTHLGMAWSVENGKGCCQECKQRYEDTEFFGLSIKTLSSNSEMRDCSCLKSKPGFPASTYAKGVVTGQCGVWEYNGHADLGDGRTFLRGTTDILGYTTAVDNSSSCCETCIKNFPATQLFEFTKEFKNCKCHKPNIDEVPATRAKEYSIGTCPVTEVTEAPTDSDVSVAVIYEAATEVTEAPTDAYLSEVVLSEVVNSLGEKVNTMQLEMEDWKQKVNGMQGEIEDLKLEVDGMQVEIDDLKQENIILKTKGARSCKELKDKGFVESGIYKIDPDSTGIPIQVNCDMVTGTTEVGHDSEEAVEIGYCSGDGCFTQEYNYTAPMNQIEALIAMSDTCEQEIKYDCNIAPLKASGLYGFYYGWWVDRHGQKKFYFDGSNEDLHVCGCYPNCQQAMFNSTCNCDASLVPFWNSDSGKITNKNSLPIKAFSYGGFISNQQKAKISVGKMHCSGLAPKSSDLTSTCSSLKKGGASVSGFYVTKQAPDTDNLQVSYCRMSQPGYQEDILRLGNPQSINQDQVVMDFRVTSYTRGYDNRVTLMGITGNKTEEELGKKGMDLKTGIFTIQDPGVYVFYLDKTHKTGDRSYTKLDLNGAQSQTNTMMMLKIGDKIGVKSRNNNYAFDFAVYKLA